VFWVNQDSVVVPSLFHVPLHVYLDQKVYSDEFVFVTEHGSELMTRAYFVRNGARGIAMLLTWILENDTRVWVNQSNRLLTIFSLMSLLVDWMDHNAGRAVHHRMRALIGRTIGINWLHHYTWKDTCGWLLSTEFGLNPELGSSGKDDHERTKPLLFMDTRFDELRKPRGPIPALIRSNRASLVIAPDYTKFGKITAKEWEAIAEPVSPGFRNVTSEFDAELERAEGVRLKHENVWYLAHPRKKRPKKKKR